MRFRRFVLPLAALVASAIPVIAGQSTPAGASGEQIALSPWLSPDPSLSTSGDFASDTWGDPWDFNNVEDMIPVEGVGVAVATNPRIEGGHFKVNVAPGAELRLLMKWPHFIEPVLPWGRDGWAHPIDGARYTQVDLSLIHI